MNTIIPIPRCSVSIRPATMSDYAFIDRLQQMHSKAVGFMPKAQIEGKIRAGHVLVAEEGTGGNERVGVGEGVGVGSELNHTPSPTRTPTRSYGLPIGYVMSQDRYFKRDDIGIVYQMNVSPGAQRKLVAATMLKAVFDQAAYGCKLFCCWCAQDLAANYFWESMGFVPLAFRTGAVGRRAQVRTHIFWQKRIRAGDVTTPYWYPCKTDGGSMREDRIVLPIPPGTHWRDEMPMLLPRGLGILPEQSSGATLELPGAAGCRGCSGETPKPQLRQPTTRRVRFGPPSATPEPEPVAEKKKPAKKAKVKCDPAHIAKARELRDRYLEQCNAGQIELHSRGKYDFCRAIAEERSEARLALPSPVAA